MDANNIPKVVCSVCGTEVTKRSTLSLKELGVGEGRACRRHEQVVQLVEQQKEERDLRKSVNVASRIIQVLSAATAIRWLHTLYGFAPESLYARLRSRFDSGFVSDVQKEVDRLGGPKMSETEIQEAVLSAIWMIKKRTELGIH